MEGPFKGRLIIHCIEVEYRRKPIKVIFSENSNSTIFYLQRISILWDELWFNSIQQYSTEVTKRVKKMEDEARKLEKNDTLNQEEKRVLVKDKYYILFKPILYVLNKVEAITKTPQSPMEIWFHGKYGKFIEDMMVSLFFTFKKICFAF